MKTSIPPKHEHPFAQFVRILGKGKRGTRPLTVDEAFQAMTMIMNDKVEPVQLGAFLMLLRVKEESPEELLGFVNAVRNHLNPNNPSDQNSRPTIDIDWSSYAGKRRHLPWYLFSIFLLAQNGYSVFMHGASGHTIDRIYTEDVLKKLNLPIAKSWNDVDQQLKQHRFAYFPLEQMCPKLHEIIELRNTLGLRSPVHTLSRLLNPLNAPTVMQGIFHPGYRPVHQEAALQLGYKNVAVIKGEGGEIECNPDNATKLERVEGDSLIEESWPALFSKRHTKPEMLSLDYFADVWKGSVAEDEYGVGAVVSTTGLAIYTLSRSNNVQEPLDHPNPACQPKLQPNISSENAIRLAREWWEARNKECFLSPQSSNAVVRTNNY